MFYSTEAVYMHNPQNFYPNTQAAILSRLMQNLSKFNWSTFPKLTALSTPPSFPKSQPCLHFHFDVLSGVIQESEMHRSMVRIFLKVSKAWDGIFQSKTRTCGTKYPVLSRLSYILDFFEVIKINGY